VESTLLVPDSTNNQAPGVRNTMFWRLYCEDGTVLTVIASGWTSIDQKISRLSVRVAAVRRIHVA
jgi:hypothetical protein